jgi:hypothetical protein
MKIEGTFLLAQAKRKLQEERNFAPHKTHTLLPVGVRTVRNDEMHEALERQQSGLGAYAHVVPQLVFEVHQFNDVSEVPDSHIIMNGTVAVRTDQLYEKLLAEQREEFEVAMLRLCERDPGGVVSTDGGDGTREGLFWRTETGLYGVKLFNAAWYGWLVARGIKP